MLFVRSVAEMQKLASESRCAGKRIALVPTMGYLHEGHASLMREGRHQGDLLVTSIFVNPTQFGVGEDFDSYPRDLDRDSELARSSGVDIIFAPEARDVYPTGYQTYVNVENLSLPLCGANRPGHFRGVTTVVTKLFNIVMPHVALFGRKDYQQLAVIRRMVADLNLPVKVVGMPIVREPDGLAMSSRNAYLSPNERLSALCLSRALAAVKEEYRRGVTAVELLREVGREVITSEENATIDYLDLRHGDSLEEETIAGDNTLVAVAVKIGKTRLIDNCILGEE